MKERAIFDARRRGVVFGRYVSDVLQKAIEVETMNSFLAWLRERIMSAETSAGESAAIAPNSYGAGYDRGFADALIAARQETLSDTSQLGNSK
jgi:hypothetical protein